MPHTPAARLQDKRTIERHLRGGQVDDKAWDKHLKILPDVADKAAPVDSVLAPSDEEDDEG
jgi:hypothetical protein